MPTVLARELRRCWPIALLGLFPIAASLVFRSSPGDREPLPLVAVLMLSPILAAVLLPALWAWRRSRGSYLDRDGKLLAPGWQVWVARLAVGLAIVGVVVQCSFLGAAQGLGQGTLLDPGFRTYAVSLVIMGASYLPFGLLLAQVIPSFWTLLLGGPGLYLVAVYLLQRYLLWVLAVPSPDSQIYQLTQAVFRNTAAVLLAVILLLPIWLLAGLAAYRRANLPWRARVPRAGAVLAGLVLTCLLLVPIAHAVAGAGLLPSSLEVLAASSDGEHAVVQLQTLRIPEPTREDYPVCLANRCLLVDLRERTAVPLPVAAPSEVALAPGGKAVAWVADRGGGGELCLFGLWARRLRVLARQSAGMPGDWLERVEWSPSGKLLAVEGPSWESSLSLYDAGGTRRQRLERVQFVGWRSSPKPDSMLVYKLVESRPSPTTVHITAQPNLCSSEGRLTPIPGAEGCHHVWLSPDGRLMLASRSVPPPPSAQPQLYLGTEHLVDGATGRELLRVTTDGRSAFQLTPDQRTVMEVRLQGGDLIFHDIATGRRRVAHLAPGNRYFQANPVRNEIAFTSRGRMLIRGVRVNAGESWDPDRALCYEVYPRLRRLPGWVADHCLIGGDYLFHAQGGCLARVCPGISREVYAIRGGKLLTVTRERLGTDS